MNLSHGHIYLGKYDERSNGGTTVVGPEMSEKTSPGDDISDKCGRACRSLAKKGIKSIPVQK